MLSGCLTKDGQIQNFMVEMPGLIQIMKVEACFFDLQDVHGSKATVFLEKGNGKIIVSGLSLLTISPLERL